MVEFKLTINDKAKSYKKVVQEPEANSFIGLKIGDTISGDIVGISGYEFIINGGSDKTGCPMHKGVGGSDRAKRIIRKKNGCGVRKSVMGNTISEDISQINLMVSKKGKKALKEFFEAPKEEAPAAEA